MKKIIIIILMTLIAVKQLPASQQDVTQISGVQASIGAFKAQVNPRLGATQANFTELYGSVSTLTSALNGKASVSCFADATAAAACGIDLDWLGGGTSFDQAGDYTFTGTLDFSGASVTGLSGGSMVYPSTAGVAVYSGSSAWGTSLAVGTSANNLVQLNGSAQLPAVSAALLTNFPTLNQNTTGTAAGLSGQYINWDATTGPTSIAGRPTLGPAAALAYGTSVGNLVRLGDDGSGNAVLPFSLDISDLTDTEGLLGSGGGVSVPAAGIVTSNGTALSSITPGTGVTTALAAPVDGTGGLASKAALDAAVASGFSPTVQAGTPSNSAASGPYINSTNNHFIYNISATGYYDLTAASYTAHAITPTLAARSIGTNGTTLTLTGSASLSVGAGGSGGFDVDCSTAGSGITATYSSGAPGTNLVYTLGTTVYNGDTCDLDYTQPGNGIEATTGGADLASITSAAITNNSTQSGSNAATLYDARVVFADGTQVGSNFKVCVYDASASNALVECTSAGSIVNASTQTATFSGTNTLTSGHNYVVGLVCDGGCTISKATGGSVTYDSSGSYATPPSTFTGSWTSSGTISVEARNSSATNLVGSIASPANTQYLSTGYVYGADADAY